MDLCLTATDNGIPSTGGVGVLQATTCIELHPNRVMYTCDTKPSGLKIMYGGVFQMTAFTFVLWSDGGASSHTITVGPTNRTLVAEYRAFVRMPVIMRDD